MNDIYKRISLYNRCKCEICQKEVQELKKEALEQEAFYKLDQTCNFCNNPDSILTKDTCCTGCRKLLEASQ